MVAMLFPETCRIPKKDGTPMMTAAPKHMSCLLVRLNSTLLFTRVRSRGTDT